MSEVSAQERAQERAQAFGRVADVYDRARPTYPRDAVDWLVGRSPATVLELGAGTGKLTEVLHAAGHDVVATDPSPQMLARLARRAPVPHAVARAEQVPLPSRIADVVVCGQSFHWFANDEALAEIGRVLRPGGSLALVWNTFDDSIPWVRRLHRLLDPTSGTSGDAAAALLHSPYFGFVERHTFRVWQHHTAATLEDLARSTSHVATLADDAREETLARVRALYDDYGRGPDGMKVPYLSECFRAVVRPEELPPEVPPGPPRAQAAPEPEYDDAPADGEDTAPVAGRRPPEDPGFQLIDFR